MRLTNVILILLSAIIASKKQIALYNKLSRDLSEAYVAMTEHFKGTNNVADLRNTLNIATSAINLKVKALELTKMRDKMDGSSCKDK